MQWKIQTIFCKIQKLFFMQQKRPDTEKNSVERMDALIVSIKRLAPTLPEKDLVVSLGYSAGYVSECRSKGKASEKFINKLKDYLKSLENAKSGKAVEKNGDPIFSQYKRESLEPRSYVSDHQSPYTSNKTLEEAILRLTIQGDKYADSIKQMVATNERNSQLMAAMFAQLYPNSKIAAQVIASPDDLQKTPDVPAEEFFDNAGGKAQKVK